MMVFDSSLAQAPLQSSYAAGGFASTRASGSGVTVETAQAVQEAGPAYFSPRITYDNSIDMTILQLRDPSTGEVRNQYPSEHVVKEYRRHQADSRGTVSASGQTAAAGGEASSVTEDAATGETPAPRIELRA
ncbi:hypothetical protein [Zavarzinia sp.]|uniref:hypothetical protein n=1 Tax=Zavarzinia sp. TaxID=2027920 RepID=UPI003BB693E9|nr:hypothetical protein [Zavarzinia sp.]